MPKKNKVVLLLSLMHNDDKIHESTGDARIPEIITFYNKTKGGVDVYLLIVYLCTKHKMSNGDF